MTQDSNSTQQLKNNLSLKPVNGNIIQLLKIMGDLLIIFLKITKMFDI